MYDLFESLKKLKFDKRMRDLNVKRKLLTSIEYDKYLEKLEDLSHLKQEKIEEPEAEGDEEES